MVELEPNVIQNSGQLNVSELFGPTWQGEGPSLGQRAYFLRLAGCNQHCSWCDTPYTWDWTGRNGTKYDPRKEIRKYEIGDLVDELYSLVPAWEKIDLLIRGEAPLLVITGGEPMLQQTRLVPLIELLCNRGWRIEIETAGTIHPIEELTKIVAYNVSPKLENSGNPLTSRYKESVLRQFDDLGAAFKFVVQSKFDIDEVRHIVHELRLRKVYIMPEGITVDALDTHMRSLAEMVKEEGWNLTTRLQIQLYGNRRGV